jgi:hypothetical protein
MEVIVVTRTTEPKEAKAMQTMFGNGAGDWNALLAGLADGEAALFTKRARSAREVAAFFIDTSPDRACPP